jgi:anti-anti-sigma regulatory factor
MKLRLTVENDEHTTVVKVDGELIAAGLTEFDRLCRGDGDLVVDLSNLRHVDSAATARLREMSLGRATLVGAPRFIQMLITGDEP